MTRIAIACLLACALALAGCGGHSHPRAPAPRHCAHGYLTPYGCQAHSPSFGLPSRPAPAGLAPTATASVEMDDSVNALAIPASAQAVAGYTAGLWPTYWALARRFPRLGAAHRIVSIAIGWGWRADCLDVEPGDATPAQTPAWVIADERAGFWLPCIYTNLATWPTVRAYLAAAHLLTHIKLWLAYWRGFPGVYPGSWATQFANHGPHGENEDRSSALPAFFDFTRPAPKPARVHCFGRRYSPARHARVCDAIRPLTSRRSHARDATARALDGIQHGLRARRCRAPYRRAVCVRLGREAALLSHRERWFAARVRLALRRWG